MVPIRGPRRCGAKREFEKAVEVLSDAAERSPADLETRRLLTRALNNLAVLYRDKEDVVAAERSNQRARELIAPLLEVRPSSTILRKDLAATIQLRGDLRLLAGARGQSESESLVALRLIEGVVRDNPKVIEYRYIQGEVYSYLGRALAEQGRTAWARAAFEHAITVERELLQLNPTSSEFAMCLADTDSFVAGLERETNHFDLAARACAEALEIINKERHQAVPNSGLRKINFHAAVESARLAARTGRSLSSKAASLRTLLKELEEKTPGDQLNRADQRRAVEGYLALAEVAASGGSLPGVMEAIDGADRTLDVLLRATPEQPRLRSLKATIEVTRASTLAEGGKRGQAAHAAGRAVAILARLALLDPSYSYDLACALALQARLDPTVPGPPSAAVAALKKAVEAGFDNIYKLNHDQYLEPIRDRDDFHDVIRLVNRSSIKPAESDGGRKQ